LKNYENDLMKRNVDTHFVEIKKPNLIEAYLSNLIFIDNLGESDLECSSSMFRSPENKEFTFVNDCFQNKKKEEIGYYGQTLIRSKYPALK